MTRRVRGPRTDRVAIAAKPRRRVKGNLTKAGMSAADFNHDGDIDLEDYSEFSKCFNGPNNPPGQDCAVDADFDDDGDVDGSDFSAFAGCFNGPNQAPACQ